MGETVAYDGLARCHGYRVAAGDLDVGEVETPIFSGPLVEPEFLLVRTGRTFAGTFRVIPAAFVVGVDPARRLVAIGVGHERISALPEQLPVRSGSPAERRAP